MGMVKLRDAFFELMLKKKSGIIKSKKYRKKKKQKIKNKLKEGKYDDI